MPVRTVESSEAVTIININSSVVLGGELPRAFIEMSIELLCATQCFTDGCTWQSLLIYSVCQHILAVTLTFNLERPTATSSLFSLPFLIPNLFLLLPSLLFLSLLLHPSSPSPLPPSSPSTLPPSSSPSPCSTPSTVSLSHQS